MDKPKSKNFANTASRISAIASSVMDLHVRIALQEVDREKRRLISGGLLLLYIVYKLYSDVIKNSSNEKRDIKVDNSSFFKAIFTVLLADFTMSLDNVLGVAGAAKDHYGLLVFGLVLSIILMATAATLISNWIKKYKWIAWLGLIAILIVALDLIYTDIKLLI